MKTKLKRPDGTAEKAAHRKFIEEWAGAFWKAKTAQLLRNHLFALQDALAQADFVDDAVLKIFWTNRDAANLEEFGDGCRETLQEMLGALTDAEASADDFASVMLGDGDEPTDEQEAAALAAA